jgi:acyl-CoA thioester hydrolase
MSDAGSTKTEKPAPRKRKPAAKKDAKSAKTALPVADKPIAGQETAAPAPVALIRVPLSVRWRDLDAFNHVNNSQYLSYLEEARLQWMMTVPGQGLDDRVAPVVAAANLNYRRPIEWPAEVAIELFVERLGNTSLSMGHRIVDAKDPAVLYCDGHVVMVWIDRNNGRAAPLPEAVRASCS